MSFDSIFFLPLFAAALYVMCAGAAGSINDGVKICLRERKNMACEDFYG
jgi:hypothetical protein